jgi:alkyl hydroperoxide reductase subunit AhpC
MSQAVIRKPAPHFVADSWHNGDFKSIDLKAYAGNNIFNLGKYVVLFFWPLDFTFVCPTEIIAFSDKAAQFREIGCEIIGCSIDSKFVHMEYSKKSRKQGGLGDMEFPLVSDLDKSISRNYGCLIEEGPDSGVAFRATYIIDPKGILRHISISDLPVGRNPEEVIIKNNLDFKISKGFPIR